MKLGTLLSVFAAVAAITCVCFVIFPAFSLARFGAPADVRAIVPLQLAGALFGGLAVMAWMSRKAGPSPSRDALVFGLAVLNTIATVVTIGAAGSGAFNQVAWAPVVTFALFAITFTWAAVAARSSAARAG